MSRIGRFLIVAALAVAVAGVLVEKHRQRAGRARAAALPAAGLPRLVELDAVDCAPCKAMASVLAGLQRECAGRLAIEVVDVRAHRDIEAAYRVRFSPTQVFTDSSGAELFRHEGFMPREDILAKWRELGYDLRAPAGAAGLLARLFGALSHAVAGAPLVALAAAFLWGVLSVVLSPCHLANIPLVIGFIAGQGRITTRRAFGLSALFAVGILTMIGVVGGVTVAAGRLAGDAGPFARYLVAAVLFAVGLHFFDVLPLPWSGAGLIGTTAEGRGRGADLRAALRRGAGPVHLRVHGADAERGVQRRRREPGLRRAPAAGLRAGALLRDRPGRDQHGVGAARAELERERPAARAG